MTRYKEIKSEVDLNYPIKLEEEKILLAKHWEEFNNKQGYLEKIVHDEFGKVISLVSPLIHKNNVAEIVNYHVQYDLESKSFQIKVTEFKLPNGKIMNDEVFLSKTYGCPHIYTSKICGKDGELDKTVKEFKEKFDIKTIKNVNHNCFHEKKFD